MSFFGNIFNQIRNTSQDPITVFYQKLKRYPGNNKQWWVTKAQADDDDKHIKQGDFLPEQLDKFYSGNNLAPRGHYILNEFYKDRSSVSGIIGIPKEITKERPTTVAFYSGRVWFGCKSTVYYSQIMSDRYKAGMCYQEADPTSEDISELIASDGGSIPIPEANRIIKLLPDAEGVLVFATNGVWFISGTADGFSALDMSVTKVSHTGCSNPNSIIACEAGIFWWSDVGILGISQKLGAYGPVLGVFDSSNISETTIQTFYNDILEDAKKEAKAFYDTKSNRIGWLYRDEDVGPYQYNRVLFFDVALKAFFPWKFSSLETDPWYVKGVYRGERLAYEENVELITADGVQVQNVGVDINSIEHISLTSPSTIEYVTMNGALGRFAQVTSSEFVDWYSANDEGATYNSYVETGYDLFEDGMRRKRITYVIPYLRRTEQAWSIIDDEPVLDDPSSCFMTVKWDWSSSGVSNKWTTPVQIYRESRFLPMAPGVYDTGFPMVITKNKVRGNGRAIQFKFGTDEPGRNFDLYGWSLALTGGSVP